MPAVSPDEVLRVKELGVYPPLLVRRLPGSQPQRYEIVWGEKIWRLAQLAGYQRVPAVIRDQIVDEDARELLAQEHNGDRHRANPIAEAVAMQHMRAEGGFRPSKIAETLGYSLADVSHRLRLLRLDPSVQTLVATAKLSFGHVRPLVSLTRTQQCAVASSIIQHGWSVRAVESHVKALRAGKTGDNPQVVVNTTRIATTPAAVKDCDTRRLEEQLTALIGSPVEIISSEGGGGTLQVRYANLDILDGILERLGYRADA